MSKSYPIELIGKGLATNLHRAYPKLFQKIGNPVVKPNYLDTQLALNQARSDLWAARGRVWYYRFAGLGQRWAQAKSEWGALKGDVGQGKISVTKSVFFAAEVLGLFVLGEVLGRVKVSGVIGYPIGKIHI